MKNVLNRQFLGNKRKLVFFFAFLFSLSVFSQGYQIPETPKFQTSVYDYLKPNLLSESQKSNLERKLIQYSDTTSTQIVIAIISSTEGENINYLAAQWLTKWGLGQEKKIMEYLCYWLKMTEKFL